MDALTRLSYAQSTAVFSGQLKALPGNLFLKNFLGGLYVYESLNDGGCGKVIGYLELKGTLNISGKFIETYFIEDFCRFIKEDDDMADAFAEAIKIPFENYKDGAILDFALDDDAMRHIKAYGTWPPIAFSDIERDARREAKNVLCELDEYLEKCGVLNDGVGPGQITVIKNAVMLPEALDLECFCDRNGRVLREPPYRPRYVIRK